MVNVRAGIGAVRKLGDKLAARNVLRSILWDLVGPTSIDMGLWLRKGHLLLGEDGGAYFAALGDVVGDASGLDVPSQLG